ncbi:MAG: pilus assembly protein TadG-related protein [Micromonosporaceae bacterium]
MLHLIKTRDAATRDRGAVTTLVAILLAGGVLFGMGALAIDVGQLYAEREELQSGADAAVMAVAKLCAETPEACAGDAFATAERYADDNAKDDVSAVNVLCGTLPEGSLPACPPPSGTLSACLNDPPETPYVEVRTATELPDGSTLFPPTFAQLLLGNEGYQGTRVGACARAAFGPPVPAGGLAVTISVCEWEAMTGGGETFPDAPPYPPNPTPPAGTDHPIKLHTTSDTSSCPAGPSGSDTPGGFGWLDDDGECQATIGGDGTVGGDPGVSGPTCADVLLAALDPLQVLYMPVYDAVEGTGSGTTYHIKGMAAFVLTGYSLPSIGREPSRLSGTHYCKGSDKCLYGFFTQALIPATGPIGGPDLGASIITLVG